MYTSGQKTLLAIDLKRSKVGYFFKKCSAKRVLLFVTLDVVPILHNKPCMEINIFERDGIIQI